MSVCSVCSSRHLVAIEAALASSESKTAIARRYGVSRFALTRHAEHSVEGVLVEGSRPVLEGRLHDLDGRLVGLEAVLQRTLDNAIATGKTTAVATVSRELRATLESLAKLRGQLDERPVVNLAVVPEFRTLTARLLDALLPYPEARLAASAALLGEPSGARSGGRLEEPGGRTDTEEQKKAVPGQGGDTESFSDADAGLEDTRADDRYAEERRDGRERMLLGEVPRAFYDDSQNTSRGSKHGPLAPGLAPRADALANDDVEKREHGESNERQERYHELVDEPQEEIHGPEDAPR